MKKAWVFLVCAVLLTPTLCGIARAVPDNSAQSAILIHADTGKVLYEKNADARMLIASTTKIMTALVALEHCDSYEQVEILPEYTGIEGSSMYLKAGERYTLLDLLYGMMLASGNDAATAVACHVAGSVEAFAALMNEKAAELGMKDSCFQNPHGLDAENHYSTARDMARLTAAAMENELFCKIVSTKTCTVGTLTLQNHNKLLWDYEGTLGVKTGYTQQAGRILVSCVERNGLRLICVTISDPDDWRDHANLYDWAYANYEYPCLLSQDTVINVPVISGIVDTVGVSPETDLCALVEKGTACELELKLPSFVFAGLSAGDAAGKAEILADGAVLAEVPLYYRMSVTQDETIKLTPLERIQRAWDILLRYGPISYGYYC